MKAKLLLLGGTTEAAGIAEALAEQGWEVLLSTATAMPVRGPLPAGVRVRSGALDAQGLAKLIGEEGITAVVDATHPYAQAASQNAWNACRAAGVRYVAFERPGAVHGGAHVMPGHQAAAERAFSFGKPVFLTIGVRNLAPYVAQARKSGIAIRARVLAHPDSEKACHEAGLGPDEVIRADGPFTVEQNLRQLETFGVLVTKDSGEAGGVGTKLEAARRAGCEVVVVERPPRPEPGYATVSELVRALRGRPDATA